MNTLYTLKLGRVSPRLTQQCCPHIETCQLICRANQLTGFYMRATLAFNGLTHLFTGSHKNVFSEGTIHLVSNEKFPKI